MFRKYIPIIVLIVFSAALVLPNLGYRCLWQDEGQTGVVAKNILKYGLPKGRDGENVVTILPDRRDLRGDIYIWQPWFPAYLAAGSMMIFGVNSFGARFSFALGFVILIGMHYLIFRRYHPDKVSTSLSVVMMVLCVPLLLHARQCRYYILVPLFSVLVADSFLSFLKTRRLSALTGLIIWLTLFFNSFYPAAVLMSAALGIYLIGARPDRETVRMLVMAAVILCIINLPVALYCRIWNRQFSAQPGYDRFEVFGLYMIRYLLTLNNHIFPFAAIVAGLLLRWKDILRKNILRNDISFLSFVVCSSYLLGFSLLSDYPFTRYLIGMIPFFLFLAARCLRMIAGRRVWVAWIAIAGIAATNTLSILPLKLLNDIGISDRLWTASGIDGHSVGRGDTGLVYAKIEIETLLNESFASPLFKYIGSLLNPPKGPVNWIVEYLNKEAASSDRIKISYDDLPVMFHTNCIVVSAKEVGNPAPEWIVPRRFMKLKADKHYLSETEKFHYDSIRFPVPDVAWDNRPDPLWHRFMPLTDDLAEPLIILRRMGRKTDVGRDSRIASMGSGSDFTKKAKLLNAQGIEYGQSGKIDEAISLFHEAEELDPDYAETYNNLGFAYYRKGDIVRAEEYFSKALEKDPLHEKARVNLDLIRSKKEGL